MKGMSPELQAMLDRPRADVPYNNCFGSSSHNNKQAKLAALANVKLRRSGYFPAKEAAVECVVDADCCGVNGLRPTWHGRAS